jgi:hypothetical protein
VIVWVNGAFGVGKSHTAAEPVRRIPGAVPSDPEPVGFSLQRMQPKLLRTDFQDIAGWRAAVRKVIAGVDADGRWPVVVVSDDDRRRGVLHPHRGLAARSRP